MAAARSCPELLIARARARRARGLTQNHYQTSKPAGRATKRAASCLLHAPPPGRVIVCRDARRPATCSTHTLHRPRSIGRRARQGSGQWHAHTELTIGLVGRAGPSGRGRGRGPCFCVLPIRTTNVTTWAAPVVARRGPCQRLRVAGLVATARLDSAVIPNQNQLGACMWRVHIQRGPCVRGLAADTWRPGCHHRGDLPTSGGPKSQFHLARPPVLAAVPITHTRCPRHLRAPMHGCLLPLPLTCAWDGRSMYTASFHHIFTKK